MRPTRRPWLLGLALALSAAIGGAYVAQATISSTQVRQLFNGDGVTTTFAIPFSMTNVSSSEVRVVIRTASGYEHLQTLTTNYTISGSNVVFNTAPASGTKVLIRRVKAKTQAYDFIPGGTIPANTLEGVLDKLAMMHQEVTELFNRTLLFPETTSTSTVPLPEPSGNSVLAWNSAGTSVINVSQAEIAATNILGTAGNVAIFDGSGYLSSESTLAKSRGGAGASMASVTFPSTGTIVTESGTQTLTNKTLTAPIISTISNTGTVTLPTATDTLVGRATTDTLTNKSIDADTNTLTNIENADIKAAAAIAVNKLAAQTASRAVATDASGFLTPSATTSTELGYLSGVTSNVQTQLDSKLGGGLTGNRALYTDVAGSVGASTVTSAEQGYLSGVTSAIQTQLDAKAALSQYPSITGLTGALYSNVGVATVESALANSRGGTGVSTYAQGDLLYASATNTLSKLPKGTASQVLKMNAGATVPEWGAAGGSGGINFVGLDSSWTFSNPNDVNGDTSIGNWLAYADAAATSPVDMTGGSPNTTCVRNSTGASVLNGSGSLEMVLSSAGTRQGEGCAVLTYVPVAYRGQTVTFTFPFKLAGTNSEDDIKVFAYDVTNSELITPYTSSKVLGTNGQLVASFATKTTTAQMRVGLHVARATNNGQLSVLYDDVAVGPGSTPKGLAGGNKTSVTMVPSAGWGTPAVQSYWMTRVGDQARFNGYIKSGTAAASTLSIDLPTGMTIDTSKFASTTSAQAVGLGQYIRTGVASTQTEFNMFYDGSDNNTIFISYQTGADVFTKVNGSSIISNSDALSFEITVPISGWDANVTMAESAVTDSRKLTFTAVASPPTAIGQYSAFYDNNGATGGWIFDDACTADATLATNTLGTGTAGTTLRLYDGANIGTGKAGRLDFFVGKGKRGVKVYGFTDANLSTTSKTEVIAYSTSEIQGTTWAYNATTGILHVSLATGGTGYSATYPGSGADGTSATATLYFYWEVSENAVSVGMQLPRSYVNVHTHNGEGSTNTTVVKFTTALENVGSAITYASSATLGDSWTINEPGIYTMDVYCESNHASSDNLSIGWTKNSSGLTTNIESITTAERLCMAGQNGSYGDPTSFSCSKTKVLAAGDILRVQSNGADPTTAARCGAGVTKVGN